MDPLDAVQKHYPLVGKAAGEFLTRLTRNNITKDIVLSAEMAGLMLLRASAVDLQRFRPGMGVLGAVPDTVYRSLIRFTLSFAASNGLDPKDQDFAAIPNGAKAYLPELTQFEIPFYETCRRRGVEEHLFPYIAATAAGKLVLAGNQLGLLSAKAGLAMVLFHIAAGSKTVPYPLATEPEKKPT